MSDDIEIFSRIACNSMKIQPILLVEYEVRTDRMLSELG